MEIKLELEELQEYLSDLRFDNMEQEMELQEMMEQDYTKKEKKNKQILTDRLDEYLEDFTNHLVEELEVTEEAKAYLTKKLLQGFTVLKLPKELQENISADMTKDTWSEEMNYLLQVGYNFLYGSWRDYVDLEGLENDFLDEQVDNIVPFQDMEDLEDE